MNPKTTFSLLANEVKCLTDQFKKEQTRHKHTALSLRILAVILAASITILLGYKGATSETETVLKNIALVLGALITVVSAYEAFFVPHALWVRETITYSRLKDLQRDINLYGPEPTEVSNEDFESLKKRLDIILQEDLRGWIRLRGANEGTGNLPEPTTPPKVTKE